MSDIDILGLNYMVLFIYLSNKINFPKLSEIKY